MVPVTILPKGAACSLAKSFLNFSVSAAPSAWRVPRSTPAEKRAKRRWSEEFGDRKNGKNRCSKHFDDHFINSADHPESRFLRDHLSRCNPLKKKPSPIDRPLIPQRQAVGRSLSSGQRARGESQTGTGTHRT